MTIIIKFNLTVKQGFGREKRESDDPVAANIRR